MKFHDLILSTKWSDIASTNVFVRDYEESPKLLHLYERIYSFLARQTPKETSFIICVREVVDEDTGEILGRCDVSGLDTKDEANEEAPELYSIASTAWDEWLGMEVRDDTGRGLSNPELIAHCLWELTFHGWFPDDGPAFADEMGRRVNRGSRPKKEGYDAFICHASEDKDVVRTIVYYLEKENCKVWFDEIELTVGDSLRQEIDRGLAIANYGIVVLSKAFFAKKWTQYVLDGLVSRQMEGRKVILPVWHGITKSDVLEYSPSLADKVAVMSDENPRTIAYRLIEAMT